MTALRRRQLVQDYLLLVLQRSLASPSTMTSCNDEIMNQTVMVMVPSRLQSELTVGGDGTSKCMQQNSVLDLNIAMGYLK